MKSTFLMLLWAAISLNTVNGQKVNIQMKVGFLSSKMDFKWDTPIKNESSSSMIRPTFAFSIDGQLYKGLYIGAEIGTCSYNHFIDISFKQPQNFFPPFVVTDNYLGWYKQEQVYFTVNPQYRFGFHKFFVVGGGIGVYNNYINSFVNGFRQVTSTKPTSEIQNLDGKDYLLPNTTVGGFINAAINPKFNNVGLVLEVRHIFNDYTNGQITRVKPDIRFNSFAFMGGLSFHF